MKNGVSVNAKGQVQKKKSKFQQAEFAGNAIIIKGDIGDTGGYDMDNFD